MSGDHDLNFARSPTRREEYRVSLSFKKSAPLKARLTREKLCAPSVFKRKLREKHERDKTWKKINERKNEAKK